MNGAETHIIGENDVFDIYFYYEQEHQDNFGDNRRAKASVLVEQFDPYIVSQTTKLALGNSALANTALFSLELDEIIQQVRIKFWRALMNNHIQHPVAYLNRIIHNELCDFGRYSKRPLLLSLVDEGEDDGEIHIGRLLVAVSEGMDDPANEVEQKETEDELMEAVIEAVSNLPHRQQQAMVCSLLERIDNVLQLTALFKLYQITIAIEQWPDDEADKQRLKAGIYVARRKIARYIRERLTSERNAREDISFAYSS